MPNWCYNSVTISNEDKTKIDALEQELLKEETKPCNHLCPRPESEEENWYDWNINNWGTKWDVTPYDWRREDDNTISMNFDSAWSPPTTLYEYLVSEGWDVRAYYQEEGMSFIGKFEDGEDFYYEYDITSRSSIEELPEDLIDYGDLLTRHEDWIAENEEDENEEPFDPIAELDKLTIIK
jgi:hypothetical protein